MYLTLLRGLPLSFCLLCIPLYDRFPSDAIRLDLRRALDAKGGGGGERGLNGIVILISLENNRAGLETCLSFSLYLMRLHHKTFSLLASVKYSLTYLYYRCGGSSRGSSVLFTSGICKTASMLWTACRNRYSLSSDISLGRPRSRITCRKQCGKIFP